MTKERTRETWPARIAVCAILIGAPAVASAQNQGSQDADAVARELANPTAAVASMTSNFDFATFAGDREGAGDQSSFSYVFQPGIPFPQGNGYNLLFRPAVPVFFNQPLPVTVGDMPSYRSSGANLGEIGFDLAYGTTTESGILALGGLVGTLPTATDEALGKDQLALGPEFALGVIQSWGVVGGLAAHQWDVAGGADGVETSRTTIQYFYAFTLGGGWQLAASPVIAYDHTAADGDGLLFPVGTGIAKTTLIGTMPLKLSVQVWKYVARPDAFGNDWTIRITISPVLKVPWG
jgi:hypothetical protein